MNTLKKPKLDGQHKLLRRAAYNEASSSLLDPDKALASVVSASGYAKTLCDLQEFIEEVRSTREVPFVSTAGRDGQTQIQATRLAKRYFSRLPNFIRCTQALSSKFTYDAHFEAFIDCAKTLGLFWHSPFEWGMASHAHQVHLTEFGNKTAAEVFNDFVAILGNTCRSKLVREKMRQRKREPDRRFRACKKYVNALFKKYKRLVVIRLELFYLTEIAHSIDIADAIADIDHFLANQHCNAIYNGMVGYIIKMEYGVDKGIHSHAFIFLNGDERLGRFGEFSAKHFGDYWAGTITGNKGDYYNLNTQRNIESLKKRGALGIGLIHANDTELRDNLITRAIFYLCKSMQFFTPAFGRDFHALRKGGDPSKKKTKLNRKKRLKRSITA